MSSIVVDLNGGALHDVEPSVREFETTGSFAVELRNHGQPVHVHLRLDEDLSPFASLEGTNYFVDGGSVVTVPVEVVEGAPAVTGSLTVVTGYGSGTESVAVRLADADPEAGIAVDDDLGQPTTGTASATTGPGGDERSREWVRTAVEAVPFEPGTLSSTVGARGAVALGALAVVAVGVAAVAAMAAGGLAVVVGIFAVLVGLAVAAYLIVR